MWTVLIIMLVALMIFSPEFRGRLFNLFAELAARYVALVIALLFVGVMLRHMAAAAGAPSH